MYEALSNRLLGLQAPVVKGQQVNVEWGHEATDTSHCFRTGVCEREGGGGGEGGGVVILFINLQNTQNARFVYLVSLCFV